MSASTLMKRIGKISNKSKMESLVQVKVCISNCHPEAFQDLQSNYSFATPYHSYMRSMPQQVLHDEGLTELAAEAENRLAML